MPRAIWNDVEIANTQKFVIVEGNYYFPPESVKTEYLVASSTPYECPWKGKCQYYTIKVGEKELVDAAFTYPKPKDAAKHIAGYFAFWKGVEIEK
ncbi:hypothetical protein EDD86DRAFT_203510 [Gorgonomyces haynaldii]|nr:hypothetical protein EDD86DRAFT_203510 [Gorgonomyces haynaldii]